MLTMHRESRTPVPTSQRPLCVDLDGTLIAADLLHEAALTLFRHQPLRVLWLPWWLLGGKANLKEQLAQHVQLDPTALPYRQEVVDWLRGEAQSGRTIVLATASHRRFADAVANHLGLFHDVLATEAGRNLRAEQKRDVLQARFGTGGFDYIGDSAADLPVWKAAGEAIVVCPSRLLQARMRSCGEVRVFPTQQGSKLRAVLRLMRPHHWAKNLLLFLPLLLAHQLHDLERLAAVGLAFVAFCLVVSAGYVINDLADVQADRRHPTKRRRPIAAGTVSLPRALALAGGLLVSGFGLALATLPLSVAGMLALYLLVLVAYSGWLKRVAFLDVVVLTGMYVHRVVAGGIAAEVPVSTWLLLFSFLFFLSLALVKRHAELVKTDAQAGMSRRGYRGADRGVVEWLGVAAGLLAVVTLCVYLNSPDALMLYRTPVILWEVAAIVGFWICRVWVLARQRRIHEDPVAFALTDCVSYAGVAAAGALLWMAV